MVSIEWYNTKLVASGGTLSMLGCVTSQNHNFGQLVKDYMF